MTMISVVMGVYNGEAVIDSAIESIRNQTVYDWELIIGDDCSSDGTYKKLEKWAMIDQRIKPFRNATNLRLAATLNLCLERAAGEYIARMDDDDISYPQRFEKQIDFLMTNPNYGFVSSLVDCYDGSQIVKNQFYRVATPRKQDFFRGTQFVHPATMFRRECLDAVGGYRVAKETRRAEDYDLFMRLYAAGYYGYNIQEPLLRYLVNPDVMKKRRLYRYRIDEAKVRWHGFKALKLMPQGIIYVVRPLLVGLIPHRLMWELVYKNHS